MYNFTKTKFIQIITIIHLILFSSLLYAENIELAITVDDLPIHGNLPPGMTRLDVVDKILAAFKKHHISGVYGFINGKHIEADPSTEMILKRWIKAGHLLGNHTYSHQDIVNVSNIEFQHEIIKNEPILQKWMHWQNYHLFRYPYLAEGNTKKKRDLIKKFLFKHNYQIAEVTTDFFDFEWNAPYARCVRKNDRKAIDWLKHSFLKQSLNAITISHLLSQMLFGRDIKHILLLHIGAFDAEMLDTVLTTYEKHGVKFIPLSEALADPIYQINPNIIRDRTYTFLNQIRLSEKLDNPPLVNKLYAELPESKLRQLCKN